jgi:hypothetical protein
MLVMNLNYKSFTIVAGESQLIFRSMRKGESKKMLAPTYRQGSVMQAFDHITTNGNDEKE